MTVSNAGFTVSVPLTKLQGARRRDRAERLDRVGAGIDAATDHPELNRRREIAARPAVDGCAEARIRNAIDSGLIVRRDDHARQHARMRDINDTRRAMRRVAADRYRIELRIAETALIEAEIGCRVDQIAARAIEDPGAADVDEGAVDGAEGLRSGRAEAGIRVYDQVAEREDRDAAGLEPAPHIERAARHEIESAGHRLAAACEAQLRDDVRRVRDADRAAGEYLVDLQIDARIHRAFEIDRRVIAVHHPDGLRRDGRAGDGAQRAAGGDAGVGEFQCASVQKMAALSVMFGASRVSV